MNGRIIAAILAWVLMVGHWPRLRAEDLPASKDRAKAETPDSLNEENSMTPLQRYVVQVRKAALATWIVTRVSATNEEAAQIKVRFQLDKDGKLVQDSIRVNSKDADALTVEAAVKAIMTSQYPAIPKDLLSTLKGGLFEIQMLFVYKQDPM